MTSVAERLADLEVQDLEGGRVKLKETWADGPVILAFIRHFG